MKREMKIMTTLTEQEYKEFIVNYAKQLTSGKCNSKSDYIRQMLGLNGTQPIKETNQDAIPDKNPETNSKIVSSASDTASSQLVQDFDKLDF